MKMVGEGELRVSVAFFIYGVALMFVGACTPVTFVIDPDLLYQPMHAAFVGSLHLLLMGSYLNKENQARELPFFPDTSRGVSTLNRFIFALLLMSIVSHFVTQRVGKMKVHQRTLREIFSRIVPGLLICVAIMQVTALFIQQQQDTEDIDLVQIPSAASKLLGKHVSLVPPAILLVLSCGCLSPCSLQISFLLFAVLEVCYLVAYFSGFLDIMTDETHTVALTKSEDASSNTPIIINNFQKLTSLRRMVHKFSRMGYRKIFIVDNNSTYPPLLNWYSSHDCQRKCEVIYLRRNVGYRAMWDADEVRERFTKDWYVYTDPDLDVDALPSTFVADFKEVYNAFGIPVFDYRKSIGEVRHWDRLNGPLRSPPMMKVGSALRIDDIPDYNTQKSRILQQERPLWAKMITAEYKFRAPTPSPSEEKRRWRTSDLRVAALDTTLAVYPPGYTTHCYEGIRVAGPYTLRHLPWYDDPSKPLSDETLYYLTHRKNGWWGVAGDATAQRQAGIDEDELALPVRFEPIALLLLYFVLVWTIQRAVRRGFQALLPRRAKKSKKGRSLHDKWMA